MFNLAFTYSSRMRYSPISQLICLCKKVNGLFYWLWMGLGILSLIGRKPALPFINKHKGLISLLPALLFKPLKIICFLYETDGNHPYRYSFSLGKIISKTERNIHFIATLLNNFNLIHIKGWINRFLLHFLPSLWSGEYWTCHAS